MKLSKHYRPLNVHLEYNGDGRFPHERIKGIDKYFMKRKRRLFEKKECKLEINLQM